MSVTNIIILAGPLKVSGSSSRTFDVARGLMLHGRKVEVLSSGGSMVQKFINADVPVHLHRAARPGRLNRLCMHSLIEHVKDFAPQVIDCQTASLSRVAARLARAARCVYLVAGNSREKADVRIKRSSRFRGIIASDETVRGHLVNTKGIPKSLISVIPDGVDVDDAPAVSEKRHVPVVGVIAPLRRGQGLEDFLRAARLLRERNEDIHFLVAGNGPLRRRMGRMVSDLGLKGNVTFCWAKGDYRSVLTALDVLVMPAHDDGNVRLALEAVTCRRPIVATGTGGLPGIVKDGETGMLVHKGKPAEIADAVDCLINNDDIVEDITEAAARWVHEHHNIVSLIGSTIKAYKRAADEQGS